MPEQDPLAQLRDIHLPEAISAWPPAPGWWILALLLLILVSLASYFIFKRIQANRYRRLAKKQLLALQQYSLQPQQYLQQLNALLKQTAMTAHSVTATDIAQLSGKPWLEFLDQSANTDQFQHGAGKVLADGPYAPTTDANPEQLQQLALRWIKQHNFNKQGGQS
ncbi:DUF4381 domain-containing protein [Oceanicoccus sp. KOV_DT_Chl]|uniref:DUF4381 domain-containing protein n=1 Tax=Oceanicoccus sp. KOV_DT_Chl TaxID=1904639 RepID=UPI00135BD546|nr:DUF4381 domain-containing protein [Oceanicoccus sp. KOV_DT_Chl]